MKKKRFCEICGIEAVYIIFISFITNRSGKIRYACKEHLADCFDNEKNVVWKIDDHDKLFEELRSKPA